MGSETALESGGQDGYSVKVGADVDEASFQKADRNVSGLEGGLKKLSKVDLSALTTSIKAIAAGMAGVATFTVLTNFDEVQNMLKAAKAGLTNDAFKRWSTVEMQLGFNKGALTKDLASVYEQVNRIKTRGDLNKDQFLALGLTGANAESFINEQDMTKRVGMVMDLALKSPRPVGETASLLGEGLGESFSNLFYMLKMSGKSFDELFGKLTVFTSSVSQAKALDFNIELQTAKENIEEMGRLLGSTFGEKFTPFLAAFNKWVKEYKDILTDILTFSDDWFTKLSRIVRGVPQEDLLQPGLITWGTGPYTTSIPSTESSGELAGTFRSLNFAINMIANLGRALTKKELDDLYLSKKYPDFLKFSSGKAQSRYAELLLGNLHAPLAAAYYNDEFSQLMFGANREHRSGANAAFDFTNTSKGVPEYIENQNRAFDWASSRAIQKFLSTATIDQTDQFLELMRGAVERAVPAESVPGLEGYRGKKLIQDSDLQMMLKFIMEQIGQKGTSMSPIQQSNTINMNLPGVSTREQAQEVGRGLVDGLGQKLSSSFHMGDIAIGDWA